MAIWLPRLEGRSGPKYRQVADAMADDIASGHLPGGTQLPPHRELAYRLGLSANTTARAYAEATRRGFLKGEVGRGTFVLAPGGAPPGAEPETLLRSREGPVDLSRNLPHAGFAEPHVRRILGEMHEGPPLTALLDYQTEADLAHHREAAVAWLAGCGVACPPEESVITMGGQHGLLCTLSALLRPGELLLTESLTYMPVCAMAERLALKTATVEMDADGVVPEAFEELCRTARPKAFYLTPTLQAPTTVTLSAGRRAAIAEIAERHDVLIIEDDVFAPLKPERPAPIATLAPERTVYISSLSKSVAPGLRTGFLRAPSGKVAALRHAVNLTVWMTPPLTMEIAARLVADGTADRLTEQQRQAARRRQRLAATVFQAIPYRADPAGLHLWLPLPGGRRSDGLRALCARQGVLVSEARGFAPDPASAPEAIRLCLSHEPDEARLEEGLRRVANLIAPSAPSASLEI